MSSPTTHAEKVWPGAVASSQRSRQATGKSADVGVLLLLAATLGVQLRELFEGDGSVQLAPDVTVDRVGIRDVLIGVEVGFRGPVPVDAAVTPAQADAEVARRLGVRPQAVIDAANRLWMGRTLHQERDRRVADLGELDPRARRAQRGHVTRQLSKEVEAALHSGKKRMRARG